MGQGAFYEDLNLLVRARYSILYLVTWEEERAHRYVSNMAVAQRKALFEWSVTNGFRCAYSPDGGTPAKSGLRKPLEILNEILQNQDPGIYVLKDFHAYLESPEIIRQMRDLAYALRRTRKTMILLSPVLKLPPELEKAITILDMPLPDAGELGTLLDTIVQESESGRRYAVELTPRDRQRLIQAAQGLTLIEAENAYAKAIVRDRKLDAADIEAVLEEKRQVIRKSGVLDYYDTAESLTEVGGMDILKGWLEKRARAFDDEAREYGLPQPRGVLLMGVQGCGKSLIAKAVASAWRLPLLKMDMSMIFQSYIGSSEQNMRKALHLAENLAPVVLWVDEIEKAFSGVGASSANDSGTTARVIGQFLTWMQEKKSPVFIVATANDVKGLPPELIRKGRLDEVFFVDLPRMRDRAEILMIHLRKVKRKPEQFDLKALAKVSRGFSGAEIEQAIVAALHDSFFENREVEMADMLRAFQEMVPLSVTMREKILELRRWARNRARPVSSLQQGAQDPAAEDTAMPAADASDAGQ